MISAGPERANFKHGLRLAETALDAGVAVYLYCIDEAVSGISENPVQHIKARGGRLFACAYSAQRRGIALSDQAIFSGLTMLSDLMAGTDRFVVFN